MFSKEFNTSFPNNPQNNLINFTLSILPVIALDNNSFKSQLKYSDRFNPKYTAFIGENEKNSDIITLRKNSCGEKFTINRDEIVNLFNTEKRKVKSL